MRRFKKILIIALSIICMQQSMECYDYKDISTKIHTTFTFATPKQWAVCNVSAYTVASLCLLWVYHKAAYKDRTYIKEMYPYAQKWYEDLTIKYPQANLGTKEFVQGVLEFDKYMRWNYFYNQIFCNKTALEIIDSIYKKKEDGITLLADEKLFLTLQEFLLLRQVGHIENNHVIVTRTYSIAMLMGLEALKIWMNEYCLCKDALDILDMSYNEKKLYEESQKSMYIIEWAIFFLLQAPLSKFQYFDSYDFACQHADIEVLEQIVLFYETHHRNKHTYTYLSNWKNTLYTDPAEYMFPADRCAMIEKEIQRRLQNDTGK